MVDFRSVAALSLSFFALTLLAAEPVGTVRYTVQPGDTISSLSERYLGGRARWGAIAQANPGLDIHKLRPGQILNLPEGRLRSVDSTAVVLKINGQAHSSGAGLQEGQILNAGTVIDVAADSFVTLRLDDGSILVIEPNTRARLDDLRQLSVGSQRSSIHIERGRVNVKASPQIKPGARFEISTPSATTTVRGTEFQVGDNNNGATVTEVIEGSVQVASVGTGKSIVVPAGKGVVVSTGQGLGAPEPLLPAPNLSGMSEEYTHTILRIVFPPVTDAAAYRVDVARDAAFADVVSAVENTEPTLKVAGLADGKYYLRARAISAAGLHGLAAGNDFLLHARPEPPFTLSPAPNARLAAGAVTLMWPAPENAAAYDINITRDGQPVSHIEHYLQSSYALTTVPGQYRWQLATRDANDRLGPFGLWSEFTVVEPPSVANPQTGVAEDSRSLTLTWAGNPRQTYHWQLASNNSFSPVLKEGDLAEPGLKLPALDAGAYFVRVRATTREGIEGPYSNAQQIVIPEQERGFPYWVLLVLLPLIL